MLAMAALAALVFVAWLVVNLVSGPGDGSYTCRTGGGQTYSASVEHGQLVGVYPVDSDQAHVRTFGLISTAFGSDAFKATVNGELALTCHKAVED